MPSALALGNLKIALRGGGGGVTWTPAEGGGGRVEKWGSVSGPLFCVRTDVGAKGTGTQNSIAFGKSTSQRIYPEQHTPQIGWRLHKYGLKHALHSLDGHFR